MDEETSATVTSKLSRRNLLKTSALAGALAAANVGSAGAAPSPRRATFNIRRQGGGGKIVCAMGSDDPIRLKPFVDEYKAANNVEIEIQGFPFEGLLEKLTVNLTQATGAYDVVTMDDPWIPQFAGG